MRHLNMHILAMILMVTPAILEPTYAQGVSTTIYRTPWEPIEVIALNNCNGEDVIATGKHFSEVRVTEDDSGGVHTVIIFSLRLAGEGTVTGAKYISNERVTYTENNTSAGLVEFTVPIVGTYISLDPDVPDLHYRLLIHLTIDAEGNLRSLIDTFELFCR